MTDSVRKLLVTGGTGVLGPGLVARLGASRCIVLRHRAPVADPAVESLAGDLTQPRLGLDADAYADLVGRLDGIVHAGAITTSLRPVDDVRAVNSEGTRSIVELAERAEVPLHHVSTFYVRGRDGTDTAPAVDSYQATKREGEALVEAATVPTATYRLPILIGDTDTGEISRFTGQAVYLGAKAIVTGNAHVLPAAPVSYFDFLPRDHVADCLAAAIDGGVRGTCWIVAGREALPFAEFVDICVEFGRELGRPIPQPKLVAPDVVDRLMLPAFGDTIPSQMRRHLEVGNQVMLGMANESHLPESREELPGGVEFPPVPDLRAGLRASLRYWSKNTRLPKPIEVPEAISS